ncbi:gtpase domain containing, partial [Cystoisospora suis]
AGVAALPGSTRTLQFVRIDKHIQLIDSPGVFFAPSKNPQDDALLLPPSSSSSLAQQTHSSSPPPSSLSSTQETPQTSTTLSPSQGGSASPSEESSSSFFILRSLLPVHRIENPEEIAGAVVAWSCTETLQRLYQIEAFANPSEFFSALARRRGKLKKGGVPDTLAAAKMFLQDWQSGVIPYYTMPPTNNSNQSSQDSSGEEKKVFWKDTPHEDRQTEKGKEGLPATTRGSDVSMERNETSMKDEKEVYADLLFSQCQAIRRGEGEEKIEGEEEENMEGGQADGLNGAKRKISTEEKSRPQRKFMLLRFAPVPESEVKDKQKVRSSSTGGEKISSDMRKVNSSKSGIPRKEDPTSRKLAAKKEAKKKRKLLNKRRRLLEEKKTGGLDEEEAEEDEDASMDVR